MDIFIEHIKEYYRRYIVLCVLFIISFLFFLLYFNETKEYHKRIQNSIIVVGEVVNSTYKEREVSEIDMDGFPYTTTESYYLIEGEYKYQDIIYQFEYETEKNVSIGQQIELRIDPNNPQKELNSNSGDFFLGWGVSFLTIFLLVAIFLAFKMKAILILFGLGTICFWGIALHYALQLNVLALVWFVFGLMFAGAFWISYKLLK